MPVEIMAVDARPRRASHVTALHNAAISRFENARVSNPSEPRPIDDADIPGIIDAVEVPLGQRKRDAPSLRHCVTGEPHDLVRKVGGLDRFLPKHFEAACADARFFL